MRQQVVTAVGRELLGFIWAIAVRVETDQPEDSDRRGIGSPGMERTQQCWRPRGTRNGASSSAAAAAERPLEITQSCW